MNPFELTILGCGSATPTPHHFCASQVVTLCGKSYMVDCGEGTQYQMRRCHIGFQNLGHVFISHLHGDHWFGLIGMISSFALLGRTYALHVHAPVQLQSTLNHLLQNYCSDTPFEVVFHAIDTSVHALIHEDSTMKVYSLPLVHGVPTCGFLFREREGGRHIVRSAIDFYNIPTWALNGIREGDDWTTDDGTVVPNSRLTTPPTPTRAFAYCSDTAFNPDLVPLLRGVDLLYHEATYADDMQSRAELYKHSTAREAATIARDAGVGRLVIGHFSQRYNDESVLLNEAKQVFEDTILASEGLFLRI